MSSTTTTGGRICPACGAPNSTHSIFCAECGTSLTRTPSDNDQDAVGQTTVSFTPLAADPTPRTSWDETNDTQATQEFTPQATIPASTTEHAAPAWQQSDNYVQWDEAPPESRRGFILGVIAGILIAIIIGFFIWSSIVDQGFRDSVTGFF